MEQVNTINQEIAIPPKGIVVKSEWARRLMTFLMVSGPGLIVMVADNDAGAVSTYTQAGADYGTNLLWLLLLLLPITYFVQEMVVRLGIATGQGHAAMIYKRFGRWWGHFSMFDLQLVNFLTLVTEFAAISLSIKAMGISPEIGVPMAALTLVGLVLTGSYRKWERMAVFLCVLDLGWIAIATVVHPTGREVIEGLISPALLHVKDHSDLVFLIIAIVGTTIAPWQLFFQQSCVADKRLRFADLNTSRIDTFLGACLTVLFAGAMMLIGCVMYKNGIRFDDPAQMASELGKIFGPMVRWGILLLMINASLLGATAISLSSAWAFGEMKGWTHSLDVPFKKAPGFYMAYIACVVLAGVLVLVPRAPLQLIILSVQVLAGIMLPSAIIFLQLLLNDAEILDDRFRNTRWNNMVNWTIIAILFVLSMTLAVQVILPDLLAA